jgi:hypothetical protein
MTNRIIANMLRENTGRSFLDSGSAYGRNFERNAQRAFDKEPEAKAEFHKKYGIDVSINVYHYLKERVTLSKDMDRKFHRFANRKENENSHWFEIQDQWFKSMGDKITGLYGEGSPISVNTYNGESLVDQVLQFTLFRIDFTDYVLLQIHGGCDVRGGYTRPRVFEVDGESMFDQARGSIYCTGDRDACGAYWDTDDANHWYREGEAGRGARTQLEAYDRTSEEDGETWTEGKLHCLKDRSALCPCCGAPLKAGMFPR